jgi:hypothetical protein
MSRDMQHSDYEIKDKTLDALVKHIFKSIPDEYEAEFPSFSIYEGSASARVNFTIVF